MSYGSIGFEAVSAIVKILFMVLGFLMPLASILTWLERRQSAMMQDRLGPNRANIGPIKAWGITHFLADAVKFIFKEDYVPGKAHKFFFMWAPIMAMAPALIVAAIIPFGPSLCWSDLWHSSGNAVCEQPVGMQIARLDIGLLFYFAISSLSVYGATLAGWASHNKWAMMGGLRASSQMMSYEVTMGMAVLGAFMVFGSLEPGEIVSRQTQFLSFDNFTSSAIMVSLFFGGWHIPGGLESLLAAHLPNFAFVLLMFALWTMKVFAFCAFQLLIRWSLPRFRSDQLMRLGWQRLLPISIANVVATALIILWAQSS